MRRALTPEERQAVAGEVAELLRPLAPERVILFGSLAHGLVDEYSDVDVVVVLPTDRPFLERGLEVVRLLAPMGRPVEALVYTPGEYGAMLLAGHGFLEHVLETGRVVVDASAR
ncbi:MAG: nucleotidyltransferase domain-containing protein [Planctomycetes bacterium]|nr:nucleotidyltransferase domain-containing protein [Planctomycetota bacterium]